MKLLKRILIWTGIGLCRIWVIPFSLSLLVLFPGSHAQENDGAGTVTSGYSQKKKQSQIDAIELLIMKRKLQSIMIPEFNLSDARIEDAVKMLRQLSRQYDTTEIDPKKKGVNIVIQLNPLINSNTKEIGHITLSMRNIPLGEAIKYVGEAENLSVRVEPFAVVFF